MKFQILSLFPEFFDSCLKVGLLARAIKKSLLSLELVDIKPFAHGGRADDYPFGGGDGLLIQYHPLKKALQSLKTPGRLIYLSPQGQSWSSHKARETAEKHKTLTLLCGRYGGIDARFIREFVDEEISIGDYVLSGGESAALVLIESLSRFLPGFLGNKESPEKESFEDGLLEGPSWTRPRDIKGHTVPSILFSGHHKKIQDFRFSVSLCLTQLKRPELLKGRADLLEQIPKAKRALRRLTAEELAALGLPKDFLVHGDLN